MAAQLAHRCVTGPPSYLQRRQPGEHRHHLSSSPLAAVRYIFGVEPDLLFATGSGTVAAPAARSTLPELLQLPAAMAPPPLAGNPPPARCTAGAAEEEEVKPPILGFPEKFELALRYGEGRMAQDIEMSDSDRLCFDALAKQATLTLATMTLATMSPGPEPNPVPSPEPSPAPSPEPSPNPRRRPLARATSRARRCSIRWPRRGTTRGNSWAS